MIRYSQGQTVINPEIEKVFCNACGNEIEKNADGYFMDFLHVEKQWGYFSNRDGDTHSFDICEACYNHIIKSFALHVLDRS